MSQENVEIVRRGNAAFNRGDYAGYAECLHAEIEFRDQANAADASETLKGTQALLSLMSEWQKSFDDFGPRSASTYMRAITSCASRAGPRGKAGDAVVDVSQVDVYELREGKIVRRDARLPG